MQSLLGYMATATGLSSTNSLSKASEVGSTRSSRLRGASDFASGRFLCFRRASELVALMLLAYAWTGSQRNRQPNHCNHLPNHAQPASLMA
ncbi:hypothetical protein OKW26_001585 [Paraburkholderia sp. 32]